MTMRNALRLAALLRTIVSWLVLEITFIKRQQAPVTKYLSVFKGPCLLVYVQMSVQVCEPIYFLGISVTLLVRSQGICYAAYVIQINHQPAALRSKYSVV